MLLNAAAETLRDVGYIVWEATDGQSAMGMLEELPEIDLLITDIKMPGMNGYQVAEASLTLRPNLKVLLMTAYTEDPLPKKLLEAGVYVLNKPFDFDTLPLLADHLLKNGLCPPPAVRFKTPKHPDLDYRSASFGEKGRMTKHPLTDRLPQFREMLAEAQEASLRATSLEMRRDYEVLARSWEQLIEEVEAAIGTQ